MSQTLFAGIQTVARRTPQAPALLGTGRQPLTFAVLCERISALVASLNAAGVGRGDRVAIVLPNGPDLAVACLGVMAGATAVPLNPDYKQPEYEEIFARLKPRLLLLPAQGDHPARGAALASGIAVGQLTSSPQLAAGCFEVKIEQVPGGANALGLAAEADVAMVMQTSGTTSRPKVVPLTQRNLFASAQNLINSLALGDSDRCLHFLPMFHIGGIVDVLAAPLLAGGSVFCASSFSAPDFYRELAAFKPTWTQAVPIMLEEMLANADGYSQAIAEHSLRFVRSVSAPLPAERMLAFEQAFSVPVIEIFGMTETAGVISSNPLPPAERRPGSVGIAAGTEIRIVDTDGQPVAATQVGEVVVRGGNVMAGYEQSPDDNASTFFDGWLRTGDLGYVDSAGYLYLTGRIKDLINRGGEKVSPYEVDQVLLAHPAVADAASFAIPHASLNEDVAALVVLKQAGDIAKDELLAWLRERLAFFKIPRVLHFVDSIPRGNNGKLQRARLTELYALTLSAADTDRPAFVAPETPVAKMLAAMWSEILKVEAIGMADDFFALGGDSLKAASFINALQQKWGDTIYVSSLFDAPTLAKYERYLRLHYPEMLAKMLGQYVAPKQSSMERVTPAMVHKLQGMLAKPLGPVAEAGRKNPRAIFVLSPPRSGSTLLRAMLAGHPQLFAPPELYLLSYDNLADRKFWFSGSHRSQLEGNIRALMQVLEKNAEECQALMTELEDRACSTQEYYGMLQEWLGERILVDKTPAYAVDPSALERAETYFEDPIYIHLLRHPYGMIRSFEEAKLDQLWFPRLVGSDAHSLDAFPFERRQLAEMIWLMLHQNILEFLKQVPAERQFQLRFEDMVGQPETAMSGLCANLGLPFSPEMLTPQGDKKQRMTDGIHDVSRMIGDPKFHQHKKIDANVAEQWKSAYDLDFLSDETFQLARRLGYEETVATVKGRVEFEF